jgi:histidinol dehydrogenase
VFIGPGSSVAFGDYMTGANHVLPTGGLARCYSGLSVLDYFRWTSYQRVSAIAASRMSADVATFAMSEGLPGHAAAARAWEAV